MLNEKCRTSENNNLKAKARRANKGNNLHTAVRDRTTARYRPKERTNKRTGNNKPKGRDNINLGFHNSRATNSKFRNSREEASENEKQGHTWRDWRGGATREREAVELVVDGTGEMVVVAERSEANTRAGNNPDKELPPPAQRHQEANSKSSEDTREGNQSPRSRQRRSVLGG
ncbi:unnamed protein product [Microthlaspi erraticum]|uniref:Uncharacterized protein n=1 Tax=Microthlaspi erraticum TaxID=1685480 RepID=A0A6D2JBC0_9BRAS|nr:unnamed protein product [Microthlaspi erraticum]